MVGEREREEEREERKTGREVKAEKAEGSRAKQSPSVLLVPARHHTDRL